MCAAIAMGAVPASLIYSTSLPVSAAAATTTAAGEVVVGDTTFSYKISGKNAYLTSVSSSAKKVTIPDALGGKSKIIIDSKAFSSANVPNLKQVVISNSVNKINAGAFSGCTKLVSLVFGTNSSLQCEANTITNLRQLRMDSISPTSIPADAIKNLKSSKTITKVPNSYYANSYAFSGTGWTNSDGFYKTSSDKGTYTVTAANKQTNMFQYRIEVREEGSTQYTVKKDWTKATKQNNVYKLSYSGTLGIGRHYVRIATKDSAGIVTYKIYKTIVGFDTTFNYGSSTYNMWNASKINVKTKTSFNVSPVSSKATYKIEYKKKSAQTFNTAEAGKVIRFNSSVPYVIKVTITDNKKTMSKTWEITPKGGLVQFDTNAKFASGVVEVLNNKGAVFETLTFSSTGTLSTYLPAGTYKIKAKTAPKNHTTTASTVSVTVQNNKSCSISASSLFKEKTAVLKNNSTISATSVTLGSTVKMTASASGGTGPYTYAFYYKKSSSKNWTVIGAEFGTATSATFKPGTINQYDAKVVIKDKQGATATKIFTVVSNSTTPLSNNSTISAASVEPNTKITVTAKAAGGASGYKYAFYYKAPGATKWTTIGTEFGTAATASFTASATGTFTVKSVIKDQAGTQAIKKFSVVCATTLKNNSTISATTVAPNTTITLTGKATGGISPYKYSFAYKKESATVWTQIGTEFGTAATGTFKPTAAGKYNARVTIKDSSGKTVTKIFNVLCAVELKNNSTISSSSVTPNTAVTITGKASGGTSPYQYSFEYKKSTASTWTTIKAMSITSTAAFKPTAAATYQVRVIVKDSNSQQLAKVFEVVCASEFQNNSTISANAVTPNTAVTITGKAAGGKSPYTYQYGYRKKGATTWTYIGGSDYTSATTATFKPTAAGTYEVMIAVKDGSGTILGKILPLVVKEGSTVNTCKFTVTLTTPQAEKIQGVKLALKHVETSKGLEAATNAQGIATFSEVPYGKYRLYVSLPDGYTLTNPVYELIFDTSTKALLITANKVTEGQGTIQAEVKLSDGTACKKFKVVLQDSKGNTKATKTPDSNGMVTFNDMAYGKYTISVTGLPNGYSSPKQTIDLQSTKVMTQFSIPVGAISTTGTLQLKGAPGSKFTVYDANNKVIATATTPSSGICIIKVEGGVGYKLKCTAIPAGYYDVLDRFIDEGFEVIVGKTYQYDATNLFIAKS